MWGGERSWLWPQVLGRMCPPCQYKRALPSSMGMSSNPCLGLCPLELMVMAASLESGIFLVMTHQWTHRDDLCPFLHLIAL